MQRNRCLPLALRVGCVCMAFGWPAPPVGLAADSLVWLEGERPSSINCSTTPEGVGHPEFLSEKAWLKISMDADKVEKEAPADGVRVGYAFRVSNAAEQEIWARIGYEFVRSPFDWRLDQGEWTRVSPEELTTDLMELSLWSEVAWLKLGRLPLPIGSHTLEFRLPKTTDAKGKTSRMLFALDALCLFAGEFHPYSHFKPAEDHRTDRDRQAARQVFHLPAAAEGTRSSVRLQGLWEVCRDDEQLPAPVAEPIRDLPRTPQWTALEVPGDKNQRDDLVFAHRLWYRTRIAVPASLAGRAFFLVFPENNLNTTVQVNGQYCGFDKNPFARVQIDVTRGIKPGTTNEIWVGIRDAWYGYSASATTPLKLRKRWNLPKKYLGEGFQDLAYPIWNHPQSGLLGTPELVAAGSVYVSDVFVKPSVARRELSAEVTLLNPGGATAAGEMTWEAVAPDGRVESEFPPQAFTLQAGESRPLQLKTEWRNPRLWWPDDPNLYSLRVTLKQAGKAVDVHETRFGFREWTADGPHFRLNGIKWHGWADCFTAPSPDAWVKFYRESNQRMMRFWGTRWQGLPPEEALDFFDRQGVVCRRSGILDGEAIGYHAMEQDAELRKLLGSDIKVELMTNWLDQIVAQVKGERNHPSINVWSIENEWLYINCINLHGGHMDEFERWVTKVSDAVRATDPTRFTMTDGGGANKDQSMPVHGNHYVFNSGEPDSYPALAYTVNPTGGGRGRWVWDEQRPRFLGEDYFANGINPFDYAYFGGEVTFQGKAQAHAAAGRVYRLLTEGYRWAGHGAWHFWMGQHEAQDQYGANAPRAVFCRQWDWTFAGGQKVSRSFGIFNDTRSNDAIGFTRALILGGREISRKTTTHHVAAGESDKWDEVFAMPQVSARTEGELVLTLSVNGAVVFRDSKPVSVLDTVTLSAR